MSKKIREEYERRLGSELGSTFFHLWIKACDLQALWQEYAIFYGASPERIALLNRVAPFHFYQFQHETWDLILLHIRRITDPPGSDSWENLSIQRLGVLCQGTPVHATVQAKVDQALSACDFARAITNKRVAHNDLAHIEGRTASPLHSSSRETVSASIRAIHAVLNTASMELLNEDLGSDVDLGWGGAESLILIMEEGLAARDVRRERRESGEGDARAEYLVQPVSSLAKSLATVPAPRGWQNLYLSVDKHVLHREPNLSRLLCLLRVRVYKLPVNRN